MAARKIIKKHKRIKVVSVKPFLNKNLNAKTDAKGNPVYPLYYQVTFERKNTQLKSCFNKYLDQLPAGDPDANALINFEQDCLKKIVQYEKRNKGKAFHLAGLKQVYEQYVLPADCIFQRYLKKKLLKIISLTHSEFQNVLKFEGFETHFLLLYKASKKLFDNLNKYTDIEYKEQVEAYKCFNKAFPEIEPTHPNYLTLIDWIMGEKEEIIKKRIMEYCDDCNIRIKKVYSHLQHMIEDQHKYINFNL